MIHDITLADPLERVSPPETVLRIAAVQDALFVSIQRHENDGKTDAFVTVAEQVVSLPALREALDLLRHDVDREGLRPKRGETAGWDTEIAGVRYGVVPL